MTLHPSVRRAAAFCAGLVVLTSLPLASLASTTALPVLPTPDDQLVTQGDFLRAAMKGLHVVLMEDQKKLPYQRVPAALMPYVQTAHELGAMAGFASSFHAGQIITKGQALQMLVALDALKPAGKLPAKFTDVHPTSPVGQAVEVAIEKSWLTAKTTTVFGVNDPVTGKIARSLLQKAGASLLDDRGSSVRVTIPVVRSRVRSQTLPSLDTMQTIWQLLNDQYLYRDKIKPEDSGFKAVEGLVNSLNDPYTQFMRPLSAKSFDQQLAGEVTGIGAQVDQQSGALLIIAPLSDSPAERAGLLPGDIIMSADGVSLKGLGLDEAVSKVRGPKGSTVLLHINRSGNEFDVSVVRDMITVPEIKTSWQGTVAVVKLLQFGDITDGGIRATFTEIAKKNPTGIVLDLRNNPGGLLHAAGETISNFVPSGTAYVSILEKDQKASSEKTTEDPTIDPSVKIVVLVNKGSASAAEIVAAALQDLKRATVVGEQSYGKGTVQQIWHFTDGSSFKMTIAEYRPPSGEKIDKVGVTPDIVITQEQGDRDAQMLRALDLLR